MKNPVWWNIYIGPQQQKQPDGGGPGCMVYPLKENCPTQVTRRRGNGKLGNTKERDETREANKE